MLGSIFNVLQINFDLVSPIPKIDCNPITMCLCVGMFIPAIRAIDSTYPINTKSEWRTFPSKILKLKNRAILLCKSMPVNVIILVSACDVALYR